MPDSLINSINKSITDINYYPLSNYFPIESYIDSTGLVPVEFYTDASGIFGTMSITQHKVSDISINIPQQSNEIHFIKSGIALGLIVFFLFILIYFKNSIISVYKILTDYRFSKKQFEESTTINVNNPVVLNIFTICILGISVFLTGYDKNIISNFLMLPSFFLIFAGISLLQNGVLKVSGWASESVEIFGEILFNRNYYWGIIGLFLFPVTLIVLLYNLPVLSIILIYGILLGTLVLLMIIRILKVFSEARVSYFFRFLYLCTFEISPYLALLIVFKSIS